MCVSIINTLKLVISILASTYMYYKVYKIVQFYIIYYIQTSNTMHKIRIEQPSSWRMKWLSVPALYAGVVMVEGWERPAGFRADTATVMSLLLLRMMG